MGDSVRVRMRECEGEDVTYFAYAFSRSALQNSLASVEWMKISFPL